MRQALAEAYVDDAAAQPGRPPDQLAHYAVRNGILCAGTHLLLDFYDATRLDELSYMDEALRTAVAEAGATLLELSLHHFTPYGGISGVAVLAESHLSVHTWPETGYAAFDAFMCGTAEPRKAGETLKRFFSPSRVILTEHLRGAIS